MHKREDKYSSEFATADEMVASAIPEGSMYHTVPGYMEINAWLPMLKNVLWIAVGGALALAAEIFFGIPLDVAFALVLIPFFVYAFIKGFRSRPDAIAISDDKVWLFSDVVYNRSKKKFGFDELYEIPKSDIKKCWNFQLFTLKFKVPKQITVKHRQGLFMRLDKYYERNTIGVGEAKKQLFGS